MIAETQDTAASIEGKPARMVRVSSGMGVVPRDRLPDIVRRIQEISAKHMVKAYLLFHAGDGNIHPNIAYDERDASETARVKAAGHEMLQACVELGGSLSGEHGIGLDKRDAMAWLFTPETLRLFHRVKDAIDPQHLANPDKLFPLPGAKPGPGFVRPPLGALSEYAELLVDKVRSAPVDASFRVRGASTRFKDETPAGALELLTTGLGRIADIDKRNYTLTVETGVSVHSLHRELESQGVFVRLPKCGGTVGGLLATRPWLGLREDILGMRVLLSNGEVVELGGKVVKNVAGYDLARLLLGSWGTYGVILEVTMKLHARPVLSPATLPLIQPPKLSAWAVEVRKAFDPAGRLNPWLVAR